MKRSAILFFLSIIMIVSGLRAQRITSWGPESLTLRAVSLGSLDAAITVGDSAYIAITHTARASNGVWTELHSGFAPSITLDAVAYAGDTLHAVIAGSQGSLAWTSDGGTTWISVALGTTATIRALIWNGQDVIVGVGDGGLMIRSTDQGQHWNPISSTTTSQLNAISFGTSADAVAVGNDTTLIQTHDGGRTWAPLPFPYNFHAIDHSYFDTLIKRIDFSGVLMIGTDSLWVNMTRFISPLFMYRGGPNPRAFDTTEAGLKLYAAKDFTAIVNWARTIPNIMATSKSDFLMYDSSNQKVPTSAQSQWFQTPLEFTSTAPGTNDLLPLRFLGAAVWIRDTSVVFCAVGQNASVLRWALGKTVGLLLTVDDLPRNPLLSDFIGVSILPNGYGYATSLPFGILRTTDSGRTWASITNPIRPSTSRLSFDSTFTSVVTFDSITAMGVGWDGMVYKISRTDSGFRGVNVAQDNYLRGIGFSSKDSGIIVGDFGTIMLTTDAGNTWQVISDPEPNGQPLYSVAFQNSRDGVIVGDVGTILRTTDGGATWTNVLTAISNQYYTMRQVQAFPDGTFLANGAQLFGESILYRSTDTGQNWNAVPLPVGNGDTAGMSFYSPQIGIIAAFMTSSESVPDTAHLYYTTNAGSTWVPFTIPMFSNNRLVFHWLSAHEVMIYGLFSIEDVDFSASGVRVINMYNAPPLQVYPNPSTGDIRVDYVTKLSGPVQIELWDEVGKKLETPFSAEEPAGAHERTLILPKGLHGTFFLRLSSDGAASTTKLNIP